MKVVIIDNYDSFTYNRAHLVKELGADVMVFRNDQFQLPELERFDKIILSPGPDVYKRQTHTCYKPIPATFVECTLDAKDAYRTHRG